MYKGENLSVIIATYNEERNIVFTVKRVHKSLPKAEIIIVDDGSKDATVKVATAIRMKNVKIISYRPNMGKGRAIKVGIKAAKRAIHAQLDADSQFPPEELSGLVKPILTKKADIVFGSRFIQGSTVRRGSLTLPRRLANYFVSGITSLLCRKRFSDVNAGFKAWKNDVIRSIDFQCNHFGYEPEIAMRGTAMGFNFAEVPVNYSGRQKGKSNVKLWRDGVVILIYLFKLEFILLFKNFKR